MGNMVNFEETRGGVAKSGVLEHKSGNISETRIKIEERLLSRAYRNSSTLFRTVPSLTPYDFLFPKIVGSQLPSKILIAVIPGTGEYGPHIWPEHSQVHPNRNPLKFWRKGSMGVSRDCPTFLGTSYYPRNR